MEFVHLHVYSSYSLLFSTISIDSLVEQAKRNQFNSLAITDRNVMYGVIPFYNACVAKGIKPIIGLTVDIIDDNDEVPNFPIVLLAKNNNGYRNLLKISSAIQTKSEEGIPINWLAHYTEGLFAITAGRESVVEHYLLNNEVEQAKQHALRLANMFEKNSFYLALQNDGSIIANELCEQIASLSDATKIPLVATNQVTYLHKKDMFAHRCLLAIKNGEKLTRGQIINYFQQGKQVNDKQSANLESRSLSYNSSETEQAKEVTKESYFKCAKEMYDTFSQYKQALVNTVKIAEKCNVTIDFNKQLLPKYPVKDGTTSSELLRNLCQQGLKERYSKATEKHLQRLNYELEVIKTMGFSDYFLIVWDFMKFAREQKILTGPGRGSAAGSIVAYLLHITDVDPLKYNLIFERFLNPERVSLPDIDIDFPDKRRDEVINYVAKKYGTNYVAQIITFGTFGAKAALRDTGRVFGLDRTELDNLSRMIPSNLGITLREAYNQSNKLKDFVERAPENKLLFETACTLEGLPRHTSTHAAGVVISDQPLVDIVPIQAGHDGIYLTQFSMDYLEQLGLLKMDFLGLRNLTLIESIVESINNTTEDKIDISKIDFNDKKTYELLSSGDTTGIFQLESEGMQQVLVRLKPSTFEDVVAVNALYRPGPMENIPLYIDRKHNRKEIIYPHNDLQPILANTYGVIVYQEQIMQIAAKLAGFTLGEADLLRKAVSKKQEDVLQKERNHFVQGALKNGYDIKTAETIYDLIVKFAHYGFNRSHAVAYSMIAYQLAYLKAHYPLQFMTALLTSAIGSERKINQYIHQLKNRGFTVLPPSINESRFSFYIQNNKVRYSLAAIKGVGRVALREIFKARREKRFSSIFDFCLRVPVKFVNRATIEALINAGCFDEFGKDRATLLATLDVAINHAQLVQPISGTDQLNTTVSILDITPKYVEVDPIRIEDKLRLEKEVLGVYLSDHPLSYYEKQLQMLEVKYLNEIIETKGEFLVGALITEVRKIRTKKGQSMAFLKISDETAELDAVVFPEAYRNSSVLLNEGEIVLITGRSSLRNGKKQLIVNECERLDDIVKNLNKTLYIKLNEEASTPNNLHSLHRLMKKFEGCTPVILYYEADKRATQLAKENWVTPTKSLIVELQKMLGKDNVILKT